MSILVRDANIVAYPYFQIRMDDPPRKRVRTSSPSQCLVCDHEKCIICQKINPQCSTNSTENGRERLKEAAGIWKDIVYERLKLVDHNKFQYHVNNNCYKTYVNKKKLGNLYSMIPLWIRKVPAQPRKRVLVVGRPDDQW